MGDNDKADYTCIRVGTSLGTDHMDYASAVAVGCSSSIFTGKVAQTLPTWSSLFVANQSFSLSTTVINAVLL